MAYRESKQFQSFRDKLHEKGMGFRTLDQVKLGKDHMIDRGLVYNREGEKHPVPVVIIDSPDGYMLYITAPTNRIEDDIKLLTEME